MSDPGLTRPTRSRLAVGLSPGTEGEFVGLVESIRPLLAERAVVAVVPALDHEATERRVGELVGACAGLVVEPAHLYLVRGHDRAALVGDDPVARGRSLAGAPGWVRAVIDGEGIDPEGIDPQEGPDPSTVVAWLGSGAPAAPPGSAHRCGPGAGYVLAHLENGRLLIRTAWGGKLLAFTADRSLTPDLALDGVYDPAFVRFLESEVGRGDVAVDVGANVGLFTVRLAQLVGPSGSVLALEADPEVHALLQENLDMNYVSGWARALPLAAFSSRTSLTFHRTSRFRGNGSILEKGNDYKRSHTIDHFSSVSVDAVPLDELLRDVAVIRLVKVDVEGAERHVLEGLSRTIAEGRVRTLAIEFVRAGFGEEWDPLCALLGQYRDEHGAHFSTIDPDGSRFHWTLADAIAVGAFPQLLVDFGEGSA